MRVSARDAVIRKSITAFLFLTVIFFSSVSDCVFADPMYDAISGGDLKKVKEFFELDPSWKYYKSDYGWTLLHSAAKSLQVDVAEYLLSKGADINAKTDTNDTPLSLAVESGNGVWFTEIDMPRRKKMIDLLISNRAQTNSMDEAIAQDSAEIMGTMIRNNPESVDSVKKYNAALNRAAYWGSAKVTSFLLKSHALTHTSVDLNNPLNRGSVFGYREIVRLLLSYGADADSEHNNTWTPLYNAVMYGNGTMTVVCYDPRDKSLQCVNSKVRFCKPEDYIEIVKMLIAAGADVNAKAVYKTNSMKGTYPLQIAAIKGWTEMTELLLSAGAKAVINEKDDVYHYTPLHHAAEQNNKALVKVLLDNGADREIKDDKGRTPLKIAEEKGHTEIIEMIRSCGVGER